MDVQEGLGHIEINNDVVRKIASLAAIEVDGIVSLAGKHSLAGVWGRKDMDKGIIVQTAPGSGGAENKAEANSG